MLVAAGTILEGKYRVERLLGAGGMGSVWIAEHQLLGRQVAVKILDASAKKDPTAVQRFLREAQTAARLRSDHIVDVLDVGLLEGGTPFLVMELLEGETLAARIKRLGRLNQLEAASFVDQLLDGLGAAHAAGVIHRDIKPDNCFITHKNGREHLKLLDFGISKVAGDPREMRMTKTGVVMGTPYYMAPEQARGSKDVDHRCDLYAAGAILYECVAGRVPFEAESVNELLFKIVLEPIKPPRDHAPEIDATFEQLILYAMGREAVDRFQTAKEFREALTPWVGQRALGTGTVAQSPVTPASLPVLGSPVSAPITSRDRAPPAMTPASGGRVVLRSHPPPAGTPRESVSAIAMTAPIDSNQAQAAVHGSQPPTRATPSGLLGMSHTGPIHPSQGPLRRRGSAAVIGGVAVVAVVAIAGVAWIATRGGDKSGSHVEVTDPAPQTKSTPSAVKPVTHDDTEPSTSATTAAVASATSSATTKPTSKPTAVTTKTTKPTNTATKPTDKPTSTGTSPRPIDTSL
jgi:serine/threonine-protein kinase